MLVTVEVFKCAFRVYSKIVWTFVLPQNDVIQEVSAGRHTVLPNKANCCLINKLL